MPKIIFIDSALQSRIVDAAPGQSVMETALRHNVPGIDADCGGACACATCHVYIDPDWLARLPPKGDMESSMLEFAENVEHNSRLSCQVRVSEALDGLVVLMPKSQR